MLVKSSCARCGAELTKESVDTLCPRCAREPGGAAHPGATSPKVPEKTVIVTQPGKTPAGPAAPFTATPGVKDRFFANYELLEEIAQGGMGIVYKARDVNLNRIVALKMILWGQYATEADVKRFRTEAEAASNLDHPNIIPIFEVGEHAGRHFFSMRFIEGGNLADHLTDYLKDLKLAAKLMATLARAIHYAHQRGILHRDLKPANVMLDTQGQPHVADFGLARKVKGDANATHTGVIMGSPNYMSPEQAAGGKAPLTTATDIYSLGAMLYLLLTGRPPFETDSPLATLRKLTTQEPASPRSLNPRVDRDLETICLKCLEKNPQRRYGSAEALAEDLERWRRREPIAARPTGLVERSAKWVRRHPARAALIGVSFAAVIALVVMDQQNKGEIRLQRDEAFYQKKIAELAGERALKTADKNRRIADISRQRLERLNNGNGLRLLEDGDASGALLWFVEALKSETGEAVHEENDRVRLGAVIQQCPLLVHLWTNAVPFSGVVASADGGSFATLNPQSLRLWDNQTGREISITAQAIAFGASSALSPGGTNLLLAVGGNAAQITNLMAHAPAVPRLPLNNPLTFSVFSPDGRRVLTVASERGKPGAAEARVWDATTGKPLSPPLRHAEGIEFAAFSPDNRSVATASADHTAKVWDAATGEVTCTLPHRDRVWRAVFSPDGRFVATASQDKTARVWDAGSGQAVSSPMVHNFAVVDVRFSPDGRRVVTANSDTSARVWDALTGDPVTSSLNHNMRIISAAFSPDGRRIVSSGEKIVRVWDAATGQAVLPPLVSNEDILHLGQSADSRRLVVVSRDGTIRVWDVAIDRELTAVVLPHLGPVYQARFSSNGLRLLTASEDGLLRVWGGGVVGPQEVFRHDGPVHAAAFGPDAKFVAALSGEDLRSQTLRVWALERNRAAREKPRLELTRLEGATFSADGRWLVAGGRDRQVQLVELESGREIPLAVSPQFRTSLVARPKSLPTAVDRLRGRLDFAAFSADGQRLATVNTNERGRWVSFYGTSDGRPVGTAIRSLDPLICGALNREGSRFISGDAEGKARIWEVATGKEIGAALEHSGALDHVAFSPDGKRVVTASKDNTARVWDAVTGQPLTPFLEHKGRVIQATFSPDSQRVLTASGDHTARLWDATSGELLAPPLLHTNQVNYAAFSPDGRRAVTASTDGTARQWRFTPEEKPVPELMVLAQLLSGRRIDRTGSLATAPHADLLANWRQVQEKYPYLLTPSKERARLWHVHEALQSEGASDWYGAVFHLDRLLELDPGRAPFLNRRERAWQELEKSRFTP
jgi:WD40 repeat protein